MLLDKKYKFGGQSLLQFLEVRINLLVTEWELDCAQEYSGECNFRFQL